MCPFGDRCLDVTEGCGSDTPPRSAASVGVTLLLALITCCYWSVKSEYAFSSLKVWLELVRGAAAAAAKCLVFMMSSRYDFVFSVVYSPGV